MNQSISEFTVNISWMTYRNNTTLHHLLPLTAICIAKLKRNARPKTSTSLGKRTTYQTSQAIWMFPIPYCT